MLWMATGLCFSAISHNIPSVDLIWASQFSMWLPKILVFHFKGKFLWQPKKKFTHQLAPALRKLVLDPVLTISKK